MVEVKGALHKRGQRKTDPRELIPANPALILPRFAHLYPTDSGVIVTSKPDPRRYAFNAYTVRFTDGSTHNLFEFKPV